MTVRRVLRAATAVVLVVSAAAANAVERPDLDAATALRVQQITAATTSFARPEKYESMQGGAGTSKSPLDRNAFSQPQRNLSFAGREQFNLGNALFRKFWVSSPATTQASDGLGPFFNARSCQSCHVKDGRGHLPTEAEAASPFLLQLGWYDSDSQLWRADSRYGGQLQTVAVPGHLAEAAVRISYTEHTETFADGDSIALRAPSYGLAKLAYGPLDEHTQLSPKIAPQMGGMGLLAAISEADILARVDPEDSDEDGISGRAVLLGEGDAQRLGRFGLKASQETVKSQSAGAFFNDMGLSNSQHPQNAGECTSAQPKCLEAAHGEQQRLGAHEVPEPLLDLVAFYSSNLALPVRRDVADPTVLRGKALFYQSECTACHVPKYVTSRDAADEQHRFQLIWPYTDLLLHDMGEALADGVGHNGGASGSEWRTPPLWGIGLTKTVNPRASYLHDGRAQTLLEAVMWHGGEAAAARERVRQLSRSDREALLAFLESL